MSRRKQTKPRHVQADDEEAGSIGGGGGSRVNEDGTNVERAILSMDDLLHPRFGPACGMMSGHLANEDQIGSLISNFQHGVKGFVRPNATSTPNSSRGGKEHTTRPDFPESAFDPDRMDRLPAYGDPEGLLKRNFNESELDDPELESNNEEDGNMEYIEEDATPLWNVHHQQHQQHHQQQQGPDNSFACSQDSGSVKFAAIDGTQAAVAQFAENNLLPSDLAVLNMVLWKLQQQQLFQMNLLHQLQQQLIQASVSGVATTTPTTTGSVPCSSSLIPHENQSSTDRPKSPKTFIPSMTPIQPDSVNPIQVKDVIINDRSKSEVTLNPTMDDTNHPNKNKFLNMCNENISGLTGSVPPILAMMDMSQNAILDQSSQNGNILSTAHGGGSLSPSIDDDSSTALRRRCRYCQKSFNNESSLQIHIRSHTGERPFKCSICGNRFSTKGNLKVHFTCHADKFPHITMKAPAPADRQRASEAATKSGQSPNVVSCGEEMDFQTGNGSKKNDMEESQKVQPRDLVVETDSAKNQCGMVDTVDQGPARPVIIASSETIQTTTEPTSGQGCSSTEDGGNSNFTPSLPPLTLLKSMSTSPSAFPSPLFTMPFQVNRPPSTSNNPIHSPSRHLGPYGFESSSATPPSLPPSSIFYSSSKLDDSLDQFMEVQKSEIGTKMDHLVRSTSKKLSDPNQCAICYRTLSCKSALQMHYRTHTGERPFRCKICGRAFTTKGNLKTHMGVHRSKPPVRMMHQCPVCHKQFTNGLVLQQHIRMHTGELVKQISFPGSMMMVPPPPTHYLPFSGYPFFPGGFRQLQQPAGAFPMHPRSVEMMRDINFKPRAESEKSFHGKTEEDASGYLSEPGAEPDPGKDDDNVYDDDDEDDDEVDKINDDDNEGKDVYADNNDVSQNGSDMREPGSDVRGSVSQFDSHGGGVDETSQNMSQASEDDSMEGNFEERDRNMTTETPPKKDGLEASNEETTSAQKVNKYLIFDYPTGPTKYCGPLMALEDKVNEMGRMGSKGQSGACTPLEQMEKIVQRTEKTEPHEEGVDDKGSQIGESRSLEKVPPSSSSESSRSLSQQQQQHQHQHLQSSGDGKRHSTDSSDVSSWFNSKSHDGADLLPSSFEAATGKPNTTCKVCYKTFACRSALDIHYRSHTKERPFKCKLCDRAFSTKGNMKQHMMTHKGFNQALFSPDGSCSSSRSQSCPAMDDDITPQKNSSDSSSFMGTFGGPPPVSCTPEPLASVDCRGPDFGRQDLSNVTRSLLDEKARQDDDDDDLGRLDSSKSPNTSGRKSSARHLCPVCKKPFSSASALQIHMRTHTGDKPFKCNVCSKAFTTKGNLKVHMGTHMWNSSPSRRGRRMSVEGIVGLGGSPMKCANFFGPPRPLAPPPPPPHPTHDMYPSFPLPGFGFNGAKLTDMSVMRGLQNIRLPHLSAMVNSSASLMACHLPHLMKPPVYTYPPIHPSVALQPSSLMNFENMLKRREKEQQQQQQQHQLQQQQQQISDAEEDDDESDNSRHCGNSGELDLSMKVTRPDLPKSNSPDRVAASSPWNWKTSCNLCSKVCSSPGALELHLKSHPDWNATLKSPKSLMI